MSRELQRAALAAGSAACALALGLGLWFGLGLGERGAERARGDDEALRALLAEQANAAGSSADAPDGGELLRRPIPEEHAKVLFGDLGKRTRVYDPVTYFSRPGGMNELVRGWSELLGRDAYLVTNSLGFREDTEVRAVKPDLRVLVTGDSHTDGVCENADSFANVLEALLAKQEPARSVEVLNAGLGGYSFYNYLGVLERYRDLDPDVFVVACYGGNDFLESLKVWHYFRRTYGRGPGTDYNAKVRAAEVELGSLVDFESQSLRQAATFEEVPEDVESALSAARGVSAEILRQCERDGVKLVCVYIPPATNVQPWLLEPALSRALELLEISPEALAASDRIADLWLAFLQERGVATLDLRPLFRAATEPLYWKSDHHIDVRAQRVIAEALLPLVSEVARR